MKAKRRIARPPTRINRPGRVRRLAADAASFLATPTGRAWGAIVVLGVVVRLAFIAIPIRYDEAFTFLEYARFPVAWFIGDYSFPNNHLLHTLLVRASTRLFGPWEWAIRLPAFIAGVASLPVLYLLGRRVGDPATGLWAMALAAGSGPLVEYSTNGRGYTMMTFFIAVLLLCALRIRSSQRRARDWVLFGMAGIAGMYTIPVMSYALFAGLLWIAAGIPRAPQADRKPLVLACATVGLAIAVGTLLCYSPVIRQSGWTALGANRFVQPQSWSALADAARALPSELFSYFNQYLPLPLQVLVTLAALVGVARLPSLGAATVIATAGMMALQRVVPPIRVFTFALPIYFLLAALGFTRLSAGLWRRVGTSPVPWVFPFAWTAIAVAAVYAARGPETSPDRFPEARPLAEFILEHYGRTADITASLLAIGTMSYYGSDRGTADFGSDPDVDQPGVALFVVDRRVEDLDAFRNQRKREFLNFDAPRLVMVADSAELYEALPVLK